MYNERKVSGEEDREKEKETIPVYRPGIVLIYLLFFKITVSNILTFWSRCLSEFH